MMDWIELEASFKASSLKGKEKVINEVKEKKKWKVQELKLKELKEVMSIRKKNENLKLDYSEIEEAI